MRLAVALLTTTVLTASIVACSNGTGVPTTPVFLGDSAQTHLTNGRSHSSSTMSAIPVELKSGVILAKLHQRARVGEADAVTRGIYGSVGGGNSGYVYAYPDPDRSNGSSLCSLSVNELSGNIAVDRQGDLLVIGAVGSGVGVIVFAGQGLCGPELGSILDPYANAGAGVLAVDVASRDARSGRIVIANEQTSGTGEHGSVSVCTLTAGCTANLKTPNMNSVERVALAPNGDCWASGYGLNKSPPRRAIPMLGYFAHCRGRGVAATGFQNSEFGGIDIDDNGNLVSIDRAFGYLYTYSGCNPVCTLVGGPFQLRKHGNPYTYGHLDGSSKHFVVATVFAVGSMRLPQLDVYSYNTIGIRYEYSISNGITSGANGAAFSPSSKE